MGTLEVIRHPLVQHKLTWMRREDTSVVLFRTLLAELSMLLAYEVTRDLPTVSEQVTTPLATFEAPVLQGKKLVLVSILRAGNGILDGMLRIVPTARVGHIGLYRDPTSLEPVEYYYKVPGELADRVVVVVDPMLATGNSAARAVSRLREDGAQTVKFACLLAAPEGVAAFHARHPDVPVYTAAVDGHLNEKGYIVPGLGDAGDRMFGTR